MMPDSSADRFTAEDIRFMKRALSEAAAAGSRGEVPIGCVITRNREIISAAYNLRESRQDVSAHAEMLALKAANRKLGSWRLDGCVVYVSLEPCFMCASALQQARIKKLYFAASDPKAGAVASVDHFFDRKELNHRVDWEAGLLAEEASALLKNVFKARRARNKALNQRLGGRGARKNFMEAHGPDFKKH